MRSTALLAMAAAAAGVDHAKFRTCAQTGFCRRNRNAEIPRPYLVAPDSLGLADGVLRGQLRGGPFAISLTMTLEGYMTGVLRLRITETHPLHGPRWEPKDILETNLVPTPLVMVTAAAATSDVADGPTMDALKSGDAHAYWLEAVSSPVAVIHLHPSFRVEMWQKGERTMSINPSGRFYFEHHRARDDNTKALPALTAEDIHQGKEIVDYGEDGLAVYADGTKQQKADETADAESKSAHNMANDALWEESFGSHSDSKPFGPSSVGMDIRFDGASYLYGLAEHAAPMNLPNTEGEGTR